MTTLWIDPLSDDGQELIDDRINQLIKTTYNPAAMIMEAINNNTPPACNLDKWGGCSKCGGYNE